MVNEPMSENTRFIVMFVSLVLLLAFLFWVAMWSRDEQRRECTENGGTWIEGVMVGRWSYWCEYEGGRGDRTE